MVLSVIPVSLWNLPAAFSFLIELQRASTAYTLHEQKGIKPQHLRANLKTFSKIKHFENSVFLIYNNWHFSEWTSLYARRLYNSFASLNPINTGPSNENATYWLMNVVCWLAYKMVYLGKYLWIYKPQVIPAMKKMSKIVCKSMLNYKKEKKKPTKN